ncbi:MAG: hypothetical protein A2566_02330 [Candidatus Zambryskibacteria bacterium RIFOXYD1_FULL_40_13]|nr:MAG: hypothetical protein UT25_C0003G0021 [Parcubacteria group bacterium GW2011_GWC1_39_12]KKR19051.1 MAG: hypothetical protein UT49_C0004G0031 [Parcubacteria group bacterium GW2011_GWF1_39_37]KKR35618.1 MAG: hypothetical protein UT68_C0002G0044 [Parcubacteria group bacterium GW2011_GWC2_40_10]KKR52029.1 MAG: hypothetical protein UT89_C0004G0115 [Parcubacteria group bacterium GW2011_GWE1_40_20]KKR68779.1 MAG: hypothetical protein UU11_C0006G0020 [Parcubacteria group bacterium GW2011_GWF2_40_
MGKQITIVAHDGSFHPDEIFAVAVLHIYLGEGANIKIERTRDPEIIENGDYVVDVGGVYDESKNRFDHHQIGGAGARPNTVPYASFGLVWKKFGEQLCGSQEIADKIDQVLVQWIDATDNGVSIVESKIPGVYPYDIGLFFNTFAPDWKEEKNDVDEIFKEVASLAQIMLSREIYKRKSLAEVQTIVEKVYNETEDKRLVAFDRYYPVVEFLSKYPEPLFVIFPKEKGTWILKTIRDNRETFVSRKNLPESWAGKTGEELEKITGVSGAVFCHNGRFIAVAKTKEAILQLAHIALNS